MAAIAEDRTGLTAWSEEEQQRLERGLIECAGICDVREKWRVVAACVATRDAKACAERYKVCRALAQKASELARRTTEAESESDGSNENEEVEQVGVEANDEEGVFDSVRVGKTNAGNSWEEGGQNTAGSKRGGWQRGSWDTHSGWNTSGGSGGGQSWWNSSGWNDAGATGGSSSSWCGSNGIWEAEGDHAGQKWQPNSGAEDKEDDGSLNEEQRRALEVRREIEANRERMRLKQERQEADARRREAKRAEEEASKAEKEKSRLDEIERQFQERKEKERNARERVEAVRVTAMEQAEQHNMAFAPARAKAGPPPKYGGWVAKAQAGKKGQAMRQQKEDELARRSAEALAAIASAGKKNVVPPESLDQHVAATDDVLDGVQGVPAAQVIRPVRAPIGPRTGANLAAHETQVDVSATPDVNPGGLTKPSPHEKALVSNVGHVASAKSTNKPKQSKFKKIWWASLEGECPISLAPLAELPAPPFGLEAEGSEHLHYFDARFLANFLLSSCDFIDPVNRRPLTRAECLALDSHLLQHHPLECGDAAVADAFELFQRNGLGDSGVSHAIQREATAVLQHLFRFRSARRTDARGRAIAHAEASLTVIDDDDIISPGPALPSSQPRQPADAGPPLDRATPNDYPSLGMRGAGGTSSAGAWSGLGRVEAPGADAFPSLPCTTGPKPKAWGPAATKAAAEQAKGRGRGRRSR